MSFGSLGTAGGNDTASPAVGAIGSPSLKSPSCLLSRLGEEAAASFALGISSSFSSSERTAFGFAAWSTFDLEIALPADSVPPFLPLDRSV